MHRSAKVLSLPKSLTCFLAQQVQGFNQSIKHEVFSMNGIYLSILMQIFASEAIDVFTTAKEGGTLNVSQQIDRMKPADDNLVGCITPAAQIWFLGKNRLMTGQVLFQFV